MTKKTLSLLSFILAAVMLLSFTACNTVENTETVGNDTTETLESTTATERETTIADTETQKGEVADTESETQKATETETEAETEAETYPALLESDNAELIEYANRMANGVNLYFPESTRKSVVIENRNMALTYSLSPEGNGQQVTALKNAAGRVFLENGMDFFVRTTAGNTYFASGSETVASANAQRLGFYYYNLRIEGQDFIDTLNVKKEVELPLKSLGHKNITEPETKDGNLTFTTTGIDPYMIISDKSFRISDYNYLSITMRSSYSSTPTTHMIYAKTSSMKGFNQDATTTFRLISDGEYHTYNIPLSVFGTSDERITGIRIDFDGVFVGTDYEISSIKILSVDTEGFPSDLYLNRTFHVYSDKMHQEAQLAAISEISGIAEVGFLTRVDASRVNAIIIKDKNGLHDSLDGVDQASIKYVGFDIKGAGVVGFISPAGEYEGKMTLRLENGEYLLEHTMVPENNTIKPSVEGTANGNDLFMGQRVYTSATHDLDAFVKEAELERTPLGAENILINDGSSFASFVGYDALRGSYHVTMQGAQNFNIPYYQTPNKHYVADLTFKGDGKDRTIYLMAATTYGYLETAVLLDENDMLIPVPIEVSKNFSENAGGERNLFNLDDVMYGESILPIIVGGNDTLVYTVLHLYQNWGNYPLKQLSSIQAGTPYYHLSTGVTESNCITPYYSTTGAAMFTDKNLNMLPDHRAASAPLWTSQPQHTLGGNHYFMQYTDAEGNYSAGEVTKTTIDAYGPTYAEATIEQISYDGKIKVSYTHIEMPQTDENRTYYTMSYEVLEDISFKNFKKDFTFYSVEENRTGSKYTQVGYLDERNKSVVVGVNKSDTPAEYVLGRKQPYFSFFNVPDYTNEFGYVNLAFLIHSYSFVIGGEKTTVPFVLTDYKDLLSLSLDLGEVTLKKGDKIEINALLLPWGSEKSVYDGSNGKAPDQNVRDVRENSIITALSAVAVENCQVMDSVFLPKVRSTNGKDATFTLMGGENNVTVRVYGFDMLTSPKIYEKIGNSWVEYAVSSASKLGSNAGHPYDGYMVHYDGDGTFSYSFVTDLTGDQQRTFKIVADTAFEGWPEIAGTDSPAGADFTGIYLSAEEIAKSCDGSRGVGSHTVITEGEESFLRIYGNAKDGEGYIIPFVANDSRETGSIIYLKYRIPTSNKEGAGVLEFYTSTSSATPQANDKVVCSKVTKDGEWHVVAVDVSKEGVPSFTDNGGKYYALYLRLDFFSQKMSESSYIDVAFFGLCTDIKDVLFLAEDLPTVSLVTGSTKETVFDTATGEIISGGNTEPEKDYSDVVFIDPASGFTKSTVQFASCLDMINGFGEDGAARLFNRGGSSLKGIDIFDYPITTVNGGKVIFSGWTVADGGVKQYLWSCDGGKTWSELTPANGLGEISDGTDAHLTAASGRLNGKSFSDKVNSIKYCKYQGHEGNANNVNGIEADLSAYSGQTVSLIFAAVPNTAPDTLCLIAYLPNVTVE